mgnify:CR=1 FL=1
MLIPAKRSPSSQPTASAIPFQKTLHVANMDDELTVRFRVGGVYKNCYISTYLNDQRIICRKRPVMLPARWEQVKLQKSVLEAMSDLDHITIKIEEEA